MSAILAIKHKNHVWMATESGAYVGEKRVNDCSKKIFKKGNLIIGLTGLSQAQNILIHKYHLPRQKKNQSDDNYIYNTVWSTMNAKLLDTGCVQTDESNRRIYEVVLLIVFKGRIFETDSLFGFFERDKYSAVGIGNERAEGLLNQITDDEKDIEGRLQSIMLDLIDNYIYLHEPIIIERI